MNRKEWIVESASGERLDTYLSVNLPELTRSAAARLIEEGKVQINGRIPAKRDKVSAGDRVTVIFDDPVPDRALPEDIPLDVVYEDDCLLVVNKPKGMVVHPAAGNYTGTLVNALLFHCGDSLSGIGGVIRPGIVHRIDKDTSGLLVVAKNDRSHVFLAEQIQSHSFTREYCTVVYGRMKEESGTVDAPLGRHPVDRKRRAVTAKNSKPAITHWRVEQRFRNHTMLGVTLETGRTHQIRVHMAYIGHPVCGDTVYGGKLAEKSGLSGQCLHARKIGFIHPESGEYMEFSSPLPTYFTDFISRLPKE